MSQPIKPPVFIAIIAAAVIIIGLIGYKIMASRTPPPRTDAAAKDLYATMEQGRLQKQGGSKGTMPPPAPVHP